MGVMLEAYDFGITIPQDLSVVGFDDIRLAQFTTPAINHRADVSGGTGETCISSLDERNTTRVARTQRVRVCADHQSHLEEVDSSSTVSKRRNETSQEPPPRYPLNRTEEAMRSQARRASLEEFMHRSFSALWVGLLWLVARLPAAGQTATSHLQTADTALQFEAGLDAPRLVTLVAPGQPAWINTAAEHPIDSVEIDGKLTVTHWRLNQSASHTDSSRVAFIYESESPRLRLTWEWQVRADFGPVEHQIHIDNLDSREV